MRANGLKRLGDRYAVEPFDHVEKQREFRAHVLLGAQSAMRRAYMEGFTPQVEQQGELVVERHGLLTGVLGGVILLETLVKIGLAFGMGKLVRGIVCLVNGRIGFALQLMPQVEEVSKLVEIIRHPPDHVARGPVAGDEAQTPIRGHAKADELVLLTCFKMRSPGLSRTVRG